MSQPAATATHAPAPEAPPLHILILSDRDWTHPQAGGTGTNLHGQVVRWLAGGHRVTVIACSYPGAAPVERDGALTIHRMGGRSTVFPRAILRQWRGLVPDAEVVVEVVNGITFLTPLWLRTPRVTLVHHVHRDHYEEEMGRKGRVAALVLETLPLRLLYRGSRFLTISHATGGDLVALGIPADQVAVNYIGVELDELWPDAAARADRPTLLYLGRLKRYKRIEYVLDALEAVPGAVLEIAGEGDHRAALEAEIDARGLRDRVRLHGFVDEDTKRELLQRAWVNLTASSAEGWCLTVMEAAACATPTVALDVGGLPESIDHGRTGLLAHTREELAAETRRLVEDPELRDRLGRGARARAEEFTWDATAERSLAVLEEERETVRPSARQAFASSDTGRAAGMALALMVNNAIALLVVIAFANLLSPGDYGALGALLGAFAVLMVSGYSLQATVAREVARAAVTEHGDPGSGVRHWIRRLCFVTVLSAVVAVPTSGLMAAVLGVDDGWSAALVLPTGALWLVLSVQRGALQGFGRYRAVGLSIIGEVALRLVAGVGLVLAGLGLFGAFLGTTLSLLGMALVLAVPLHRSLAAARGLHPVEEPRFRELLRKAAAPIVAFGLIAALQNIDIIFVKHTASDTAAGSYVAASTAAKAVIWLALGLGLYLLPEAVRRTQAGGDARPILLRTLALVGLVAVPMILVYAVAAEPLLRVVFNGLTEASGALPLLALAMSLLACAYLSVQYLLAIDRLSFLAVLGLAAVAELGLLLVVGAQLTEVALVLAGLQLVVASVVFVLVLRSAGGPKGQLV